MQFLQLCEYQIGKDNIIVEKSINLLYYESWN